MKFKQIKIGQQFSYKSAIYTKTGPFQALEEGAANPKMIIQAAAVQPLQGEVESSGFRRTKNTHGVLKKAVDDYHRACSTLVSQGGAKADNLQPKLDVLYQAMLMAIPK